ncbi:MAG: helix-turn-helix transcriptional regulator [Beijerinckiaceae bacterium]|jgi:phage repressor protein C with HTH and peptisase S24 domain|nr:helix-turn-helix transcriptional regulator [Beijerinckiaceae bacterium]
MLTHGQVWAAIDALAGRYNLTASALARRAGLDATTFNKSKRQTPDGRLRWPSTESVAKVLDATGASLDEFMSLLTSRKSEIRSTVPLIGLAQAGTGGFFDDAGFPTGGGWEEIAFPNVPDENAYALEIAGDSMLPLLRDGDIVIISPAASIRRGDRVVVKTMAGEILAKELKRQTAKTIELQSLNPEHEDRVFDMQDVDWVARIMWSSQ